MRLEVSGSHVSIEALIPVALWIVPDIRRCVDRKIGLGGVRVVESVNVIPLLKIILTGSLAAIERLERRMSGVNA